MAKTSEPVRWSGLLHPFITWICTSSHHSSSAYVHYSSSTIYYPHHQHLMSTRPSFEKSHKTNTIIVITIVPPFRNPGFPKTLNNSSSQPLDHIPRFSPIHHSYTLSLALATAHKNLPPSTSDSFQEAPPPFPPPSLLTTSQHKVYTPHSNQIRRNRIPRTSHPRDACARIPLPWAL